MNAVKSLKRRGMKMNLNKIIKLVNYIYLLIMILMLLRIHNNQDVYYVFSITQTQNK